MARLTKKQKEALAKIEETKFILLKKRQHYLKISPILSLIHQLI
jgi:hypothetical protein